MKVAKMFSLGFVFFLLFVSSCGRMISTTHYQPNEHDVAKVEFDYPSEWNVINLDTTDTYQSIRLEEPGTPTPDFKNPELLPYGYVDIFIEKGTPSELLKIREEIMDFNLRDHIRFDDKVAYERIYIDGYEGWKLAGIYPTSSSFGATWAKDYSEQIFFLTEDCLYSIYFVIPEDKINGSFYKSYQQMVESIKILP